jgi:large subunit ribosomal protein L25
MSVLTSITAEERNSVGKGAARAARRNGQIPAVLYGGESPPQSLTLDVRQISKELEYAGFFAKVIELKIGEKTEKAIARDVQLHPVTDSPLHVDFLRVSTKGTLKVAVPVQFLNGEKSPGLKRSGVLNVIIHEIELTCSPDNIPDNITVDLEGLEIGDNIHTKTISLPSGVKVAYPERDNMIATIASPKVIKVDEKEGRSAEGAATESEESTEGEKAPEDKKKEES